MRGRAMGAAVLVLATVGARAARADDRCPVPEGGSAALGAADAGARLSYVRGVLRDQARRARLWTWGWAATGVGLAGGSFALAALESDRDKRLEWIVSGGPALWYPLMAVLDPPEAPDDAAALEELVATTSSVHGRMDPCIVLARAEHLLDRAAADEKRRVNLFSQALGITGSLAIGAFIAFALGDPVGGLVNGAASLGVVELNLFTAPTGAVDAAERYRAGVGLSF